MKKVILFAALMFGLMGSCVPVMADNNNNQNSSGVETAILKTCGNKADDPDGGGVMCILTSVMDVMSVGIGILGVLGITIVGIQYLTAGGNEEKTRKAKRRMLEIVIGIVAYVLIYVFLKFLLPGFNP